MGLATAFLHWDHKDTFSRILATVIFLYSNFSLRLILHNSFFNRKACAARAPEPHFKSTTYATHTSWSHQPQ